MKIIIDPFLNLFMVFFKLYSYVSNKAALIILIKQLGNNNCSFGLKSTQVPSMGQSYARQDTGIDRQKPSEYSTIMT